MKSPLNGPRLAAVGTGVASIAGRVIAALIVVAVATLAVTDVRASGRASSPAVAPADAASVSAANDSLPALVAATENAVIKIQATTCSGTDIGTGFLIAPNLIATVDHVVERASALELVRNGEILGVGTVIGEDAARDVALIQVPSPIAGPNLALASSPPQLGEPVVALGFPFDLPLTVTQGTVSGLARSIVIDGVARTDLLQTDAALNPGDSGDPLLSIDSGQVVGLVDLGTNGNGISFAVSSKVAQPLLQAWESAPQNVPFVHCAPKTLRTRAIERAIERTIVAQKGIGARAVCPSRVPVRAGYRFTCFALLAVGKYPMYVVETNSHGAVTYANRAPLRLLDGHAIERAIDRAIRKQRGLTARVTCPAPILQQAGLVFTCVAHIQGGTTAFKVRENDNAGRVSFVDR